MEKLEFSIKYISEIQNLQKEIELEKEPLSQFKSLGTIPPQLEKNIATLQFDYMTPIQKAVIPYMREGKDIMGCSETGSGKTIAYLFPVINNMIISGPPSSHSAKHSRTAHPIALVLVPTRELADQVYKEAKKLSYGTGINPVKIYGGVPYESQLFQLSLGCDILVSTPGRLIDYLKTNTISLSMVNMLIIDEADRILDMGFEDQLNTIFFNFDLVNKEKRQNLMFSATFSQEIRGIARKFMRDYYFIQPKNASPRQIKQEIIHVSENDKNKMLSQILYKLHGSIIIFTDTKKGADLLSYYLYNEKFKSCAIHGNKKQFQRQNAIQNFTNGHVPILIATDVASRGLDFPNVNYIINYDLPKNLEDYIHRIGRTGRMGQEGTAISLINETNKPIIKKLYLFFKSQNQVIPPWFEEMYFKEIRDEKMKKNFKHNNSNNNMYRNHQNEINPVYQNSHMNNLNYYNYNNYNRNSYIQGTTSYMKNSVPSNGIMSNLNKVQNPQNMPNANMTNYQNYYNAYLNYQNNPQFRGIIEQKQKSESIPINLSGGAPEPKKESNDRKHNDKDDKHHHHHHHSHHHSSKSRSHKKSRSRSRDRPKNNSKDRYSKTNYNYNHDHYSNNNDRYYKRRDEGDHSYNLSSKPYNNDDKKYIQNK